MYAGAEPCPVVILPIALTTLQGAYYHSDHLGSAELITDCQGREYQWIEYTPYGETWVEKKGDGNYGTQYLPYTFTGKEQDKARTIAGVLCAGLYYYGARYLDPKYSRWISCDPALGEYIPVAPTNDEAKKHNSNLPGNGGVFNAINLHLYHYAGNNPVRYTDPTGMSEEYSDTGNYLGHVEDKIDAVRIYSFTMNGSSIQKTDKGFLKDTDGNTISVDSFNQLCAMIYGEAAGDDIKEDQGMGEVVKNRMSESGQNLMDVLDNNYAGFDARDNATSKYQSGLKTMRGKDGINSSSASGGMLRNAIAGAIHGLSGSNSVLSTPAFYWSHNISRSTSVYNKTDTINGCDFFNLTPEAWKTNRRNWP